MIVLVSLYLNILFNYSFTNLEFLHPLQSFILDKRRNNPKISNLKCNFMNLDHILKIKFSSKKRNGCIHTRYAQWLTLRLYMKAWCMLCLTQICLTQICPPPPPHVHIPQYRSMAYQRHQYFSVVIISISANLIWNTL